MTEPTRLRETAGNDVSAMLRHASRPRPMARDDFDRGERRVMRMAAVPFGLGLLFWLKGIALGAGLGAVAVFGMVAVQHGGPSQVAPEASSTPPRIGPVEKVPAATVEHPEPTVPTASVPVASAASVPRVAPSVVATEPEASEAPVDSLAQEVSLVERARGALGSNPAEALTLTREHAARFPSGQLTMEREIVAIEALGKLGRRGEARSRAEALLKGAHGSLYEDRIRNLIPEAR